MNETLFDLPEQLSPRLAWMKRHQVTTIHYPLFDGDDEDEFGNTLWPWAAVVSDANKDACGGSDAYGGGMTTDEALTDLAKKQGWLLWNEQPAANLQPQPVTL